jgi:SAM-dependent methyltransferase
MNLDVNHKTWEGHSVVREYAARDEVWTVERTILDKYRGEIEGRRLLDLGCGAGRTTAALRAYSTQYVGLDYSAAMVAEFRSKFRDVPVVLGDMRSMPEFGDKSFDFVLCSFNGLDYVGHEDRSAALGEVHRVLAPQGLFVFSSHNVNYSEARRAPQIEWAWSPWRLVRNAGAYAADSWNHARHRSREKAGDGYAVLNDCGHHYRLLSYYVDRRCQAAQLEAVGFALLECFDRQGRILVPGDDDRHSSFIYYVARRSY